MKTTIKKILTKGWFFNIKCVTPKIINAIPHDFKAFTQGLTFINENLYESTGLVGQSSLRCICPLTGEILQDVSVPDVWAEGIAHWDEKLVQLTWKNQFAICYSFPELKRIYEIPYEGEGWGLASTPNGFVMSNGTNILCFRHFDFTVQRMLPVTLNSIPLKRLNDLVWANGKIYSNVWYRNEIFEISHDTGRVTGIVDCSELVEKAKPNNAQDVLNGIAFCQTAGTFFLTGKNWSYIFEVNF